MKTFLLSIGFACGLSLSLFAKDTIKIQIEPEQERYLRNSPQEVVVKIDLTAAPVKSKKRLPVNLAVVLDRSGSMSGAKIEKARQAAISVLDQLNEGDIFSLVVYDTHVQVLIPAQPIEDKEFLRSRISRIQPGGSTALYDGVATGAEQLQRYFSKNRINRMLLLSDGLANVGPSTPSEMSDLGRHLAQRGIAVSTIGLGDDYNEDLMAGLAEASDANYYYVKDVEELPSIFAKELGELLTVVTRDIQIEIICPEGVEPIDLIGRSERFQNRKTVVHLSPFASGQNRYLFLRCRVFESDQKAREIAKVKVDYTDEMEGGKTQSYAQSAKISLTKDAGEAANSVNRNVNTQKELVLNALAKDQAIHKADAGDSKAAQASFRSQILKLQQVAPSAPAEQKAEIASEIQKLKSYNEELNDGQMSSRARKSLQEESYKTRNSKSY
jgi:Ca-activated chloride channel homolog